MSERGNGLQEEAESAATETPPAEIREALTLNQIFANAHATSVTLGDERTRVETKKCPSCGAARPEDSQLSSCAFCGRSFFSEGTP